MLGIQFVMFRYATAERCASAVGNWASCSDWRWDLGAVVGLEELAHIAVLRQHRVSHELAEVGLEGRMPLADEHRREQPEPLLQHTDIVRPWC